VWHQLLTWLRENFNRFFSYQDEVRNQNVLPYKYATMARSWSNL